MDYSMEKINNINRLVISSVSNNTSTQFDLFWLHAVGEKCHPFSYTKKKHHHTFFEVHMAIEGNMEYAFKGESVLLKKDTILLIPPGTNHEIVSSNNILKLTFAFSLNENDTLNKILKSKSFVFSEMNPDIINAINYIIDESSRATVFSFKTINNRLFEIIYSLAYDQFFEILQISKEPSSSLNNLHLMRAKRYINDNPEIFLNCNDVARYCNISVKQLQRVFKQFEGVTLLTYIHNCKITSAQELLTLNKYSLNEISQKLGFKNEYYFNSFFSKHAGMTPIEFKKLVSNHNTGINEQDQ